MKNKESTIKIYLDWLAKTKLKNITEKKLKFDNFSIWSLNKISHKDISLDNEWFFNLKKKLSGEKLNLKKSFFILKFLKSFILNLFFLFLLKITFKNNNKLSIKKNCFYIFYQNMVLHENKFIDQRYSLAPYANKKFNSLLISLPLSFKTIINQKKIKNNLNKCNLDYYHLHNYIKYKNFFYTYFKIFQLLLKAKKILKRNFFVLQGTDCSEVLKKLYLDSFCGAIQKSLLEGEGVKKFLEKNSHKKFITYYEFYPYSNCIYYFIRKLNYPIKIISIQHGIYSKNNPFYKLDINFSISKKDKSNSCEYYYPDIFLVQGTKYSNYLKKFFIKENIYIIGSPKQDFMTQLNLNNSKKSKFLNDNKLNSKKIILIVTLYNSELNIINFLNNCNLFGIHVIVSPHYEFKKETIENFKKNAKFEYSFQEEYSSRELIFYSDLILGGISTIMYEAMYYNLNVARIYDSSYPLQSDASDNIPIIRTEAELYNSLHKPKKIKKNKIEKTIKELFFKLDKKAYLRFIKILNKI